MEELFDKEQPIDPSLAESKGIGWTISPPWFDQIGPHSPQIPSLIRELHNNEEFEVLRKQVGEVTQLFAALLLNTTYNQEQLIQLRKFLHQTQKELSVFVDSFNQLASQDEHICS